MSATLITVVPLALFGIVALLGFVGCWLHTHGLADPDPYDDLVKSESTLIAFWTLTDPSGPAAADDGPNNFPGTYMGSVNTNQMPGIVPGDQVSGQPIDPCPLFINGLVSVGFQQAINITPPFTVEAWVKPNWSQTDKALRGVVVSNSKDQSAGFGLFASPENVWIFSLGMTTTSIEVTANSAIDFDQATHLVVVFDQNLICTIFANGLQIGQMDTTTVGSKYKALDDNKTPLFIGAGAPDQGTPVQGAPVQFPFTGNIQCVALYGSALPIGTITSHFNTGMPG